MTVIIADAGIEGNRKTSETERRQVLTLDKLTENEVFLPWPGPYEWNVLAAVII